MRSFLFYFLAVLLMAACGSAFANVQLPSGAGHVDVRNFGAIPNDGQDDTAAIQAAITASINQKTSLKTLYLPDGVYNISDTLHWLDSNGVYRAYLSVQGQSESGTILRLANNTFTSTASPKAVIFTASGTGSDGPKDDGRGNTAFNNYIQNLTVETGTGNPGAIGIDFLASNAGAIRNVTIRSGDGDGIAGIYLGRSWPGPWLLKNTTIDGFNYALDFDAQTNYSTTVEGLTIRNQKIAGIRNNRHPLSIRNLNSDNLVPVIINGENAALTCILDSVFTGGSSSQSAIQYYGALYLRNISISGYKAQPIRDSANLTDEGSPNITEYISHTPVTFHGSPASSMNLPIEDIPAPPSVSFADAVVVNGFNDTAVQNAINTANATGKKTVILPAGEYDMDATVTISGGIERLYGFGAYLDWDRSPDGSTDAAFVFENSTAPAFFFEHFTLSDVGSFATIDDFIWIQDNDSTPIVLKDLLLLGTGEFYGNSVTDGSKKIFIENCAIGRATFTGANVWAWQLDPEDSNYKIINDGSDMWLFGYKSEWENTNLINKNGARTELIGGFFYPPVNHGGSGIGILNEDSELTAIFTYSGDVNEIMVRDIHNGTTTDYTHTQSTAAGHPRGGNTVPLFSAWGHIVPLAPSPLTADANGSDSATLTLNSGVTHTEPITITNTGDTSLDWTSQIKFTSSANSPSPNVATLPFNENFESGTLAGYWTSTGTNNYRTQVTTSNFPHAGSSHLVMDASVSGTYSRNELTLSLDLNGYTNVELCFWAKEYNEESHAPPTNPFTGGADFDGVAISEDGNTWYEVQALRSELSPTYREFVVDLDAAIATYGLSYTSNFQIRFNQYDNYTTPTDGIALDDISITGDHLWLSSTPTAGSLTSSGTDTVNLHFDTSGLIGGLYTAEVIFSTNIFGTEKYIFPVNLTVVGVPNIELDQSTYDFGDVILNSTKQITVILTNTGSDMLNVGQIDLTGNLSINPAGNFSLDSGDTQTLTLTLAPSALGSVNETLTIHSNDPNQPSLTVPITANTVIGPLDHFEWSTISDPQLVNSPINVTLTAKDSAGNTITNYAGSANISANSLNDIEMFTPPLTNGAATASFTSTRGYRFTPKVDIEVTHFIAYFGTKVTLWDSQGNIISSAANTGLLAKATDIPLNSSVLLEANKTYTIGVYSSSFITNFNTPTPSTDITINKSAYSTSDSVPNFTNSDYPALNMRYTASTPVAITPTTTGNFTNGQWSGQLTLQEAANNIALIAQDNGTQPSFSNRFNVTTTGQASLTLLSTAKEDLGHQPSAGTLSITQAPASPQTFYLTSSDTSELTLPSTVTVDAGQTSAQFDFTIVNDTLLDGSQEVQVTVHGEGYLHSSTTITITDDEIPTMWVSVPSIVDEASGTLAGIGRVYINPTPTYDIYISLSTSDSNELTVPATVLVQNGSIASDPFDLTIIDDTLFDGEKIEQVTATYGTVSASGQITILDDETMTNPDSDGDGMPDSWENNYGLDPLDDGSSNTENGVFGDADGDGVGNFLEYSLDMNPTILDIHKLPTISIEHNGSDNYTYLNYEFRRLNGVTELIYELQTSTDMVTWQHISSNIETISVTTNSSGISETVKVRVRPHLDTAGLNGLYIRLKVQSN